MRHLPVTILLLLLPESRIWAEQPSSSLVSCGIRIVEHLPVKRHPGPVHKQE